MRTILFWLVTEMKGREGGEKRRMRREGS